MAGADEGSRIRDVVRGSKIRLDILRKLDRQLGSFNSELNQGTIGIQNCSKQYQTHGRVLPRSAKGVEDCIYVGRLEQNRSPTAGSDRRSHLQEANRRWVRSYLPLFKRTSNKEDLFEWFDTVDCFFEETQPLENTKCELASYVLEDEAEQWWQQLQHRRRLDGESEIKLWPWMKFLLSNDFWPAACSIKGSPEVEISSKVVNYRHNIPDEEERKAGCEYDAEAHNNNDEIAMEKTDKFTPTKCSTNYLSNIHLEKSVYMGSTELYNSVSDYSIRLAHGAEGCVKQVEEEKKSSESCHEGDSHGKELDEELENRGLKTAKCSMKVPSQFSSNEQAKFGCCDSKAEFHYPGPISDDAYKTHVCEDVLGHDVLGHDVLIDEKQTQVGKTNEEGDKVVGKETSKKYVLNDVDSLVLPTRGTSLPLSIAKGPEVGETRLELIYRVLGILHEPLKSIWTYQLGLARNPPLQDHWSCTFVGMEFTWGSFRSKKHAAHSLLLPSMLETCSARDVFLFDPGGYIHLSDNWGLSNYLLSSPNGLASSLIGTLTLSLLSSGVINSTRKATKSIEFQGCLAGKEKNIGAWSSNIRREIEFAQSSVLGLCLLLKVLHQFLTPKKISNGNNNIVVLEEIYDGCRAAVELLVKTHHDVASSTLNAFDQHPNRWHGMEYDQNFIYLSRPHCDCSLHALLLIYTASNGGITSVGECTKCNGDHSVHLGLNVKNRVEFDLWKPHGYSSAHLLKFTRDIIHGIDHLHEFGIVHGNLSHQNIHRSRSKERNMCNKIFDMGISKRFAVSIMSLTKHGSGYGRLTATEDRTVDFPYSIIILTSNCGFDYPYQRVYDRVTMCSTCEFIKQELRGHFIPKTPKRLDGYLVDMFGYAEKIEEAYKIIKSISVAPNYFILKHEIGAFNCFLNDMRQSVWQRRRFRNEWLWRSSLEHAHIEGDPCVVCALLVIFTALEDKLMNDTPDVFGALFHCRHKSFKSTFQVNDDSFVEFEMPPKHSNPITMISFTEEKYNRREMVVFDVHIDEVRYQVLNHSLGRLHEEVANINVQAFLSFDPGGIIYSSESWNYLVIGTELNLWKSIWSAFCSVSYPIISTAWKAQCFIFMCMWRPSFMFQTDTSLNLTRGRVISWESWNDENNVNVGRKLIMVNIIGVIMSSCVNTLSKNGQSRESLKLFYKVVNGLDPPMALDSACEASMWISMSSLVDELLRRRDGDDVAHSS